MSTPPQKRSPKKLATAKLAPKTQEAVRQACALIDAAEGETPPSLAELAAAVGQSPWHLQRSFKKATGVSPRDYAEARRSAHFRRALRQGEGVAMATYEAGYGSSSRVYEQSERRLGMTPASYAKGGLGAEIAFATVASPLGRLLVATTAKGICFVSLGADEAALEATLEAEFPAADSLERDQERLAPALEAIVGYLEGETPAPDLPLDVRATAFQRRVWAELLAIPPGETLSYAEIAARLGLPQAQRAVGSACGRNPVALLIPCHRALRRDGGLGGYRWGLKVKEALLTLEAAE